MKTLLIAVAATLCLFTQSLPANTLKDVVGSWKVRLDGFVDGWKVATVTGTMRVTQLGKNSFSIVMTLNGKTIDGESNTWNSNLWMFQNGKTAGYQTSGSDTTSVESGTWRVSGNKIDFNSTAYSPGEKPASSNTSFIRRNVKKFDIAGSDESGYKIKGSMTK